MVVGYENIFPIEQADEHICTLVWYTRSHRAMYISASHGEETPFYLLFVEVMYFTGPTSWQGANFRLIEKPDEHLKMLRTLGCFNNWPQGFLLERTKIYAIDNPEFEIKIVAAEVERTESEPLVSVGIHKQRGDTAFEQWQREQGDQQA